MRPQPPSSMFEDISSPAFVPAEDMPEWVEATFLEPSSPLHNPEHAHLAHAEIGFLWTVVENSRKGRRIIGQCEEGKPQGAMGKWARAEMQVKQWFGFVPDFIITLDAEYCRQCGTPSSWRSLSTSSNTLPKRRMHSARRSSAGQPGGRSLPSADMTWKSSSVSFVAMGQMQPASVKWSMQPTGPQRSPGRKSSMRAARVSSGSLRAP